MSQLLKHGEKWIRRYHRASTSGVRLVCLPHAGGSASFYFPVSRDLSPDVEVLAIQYPGRQDRRHEPTVNSIAELADQIFAALRDFDDRPLALFGHSMGAVLAYEVALRMEQAGMPSPQQLFASGRRAPSCYRDERVHQKPDAGVVAELRMLGGISDDLLADPEILEMIMPAIRSDYHAVETYRHDPDRKLACPVMVLTGDSDPRLSLEEAQAWSEHTTGATEIQVFPGGHFFLVDQAEQVTKLVARKLNERRIELERRP